MNSEAALASNDISAEFCPPPGLANPHVQTIFSSVARRITVPRQAVDFLNAGVDSLEEIKGVKIAITRHPNSGPPITIIPGWLGTGDSSYAQSMGAQLWRAGYEVVRVTLRDHGKTAHLNPGFFNSAMLDEVVDLVARIGQQSNYEQGGLIGFSLGGNFALRVARALPHLHTLAISPAIVPDETMYAIDSNPVYQNYFVRKWRKLWTAKQEAFPDYDFTDALSLSTVSALTDYFVSRHSDFQTTADYFAAYDLSGNALAGVNARILAAEDDPIIPIAHFNDLPASLDLDITPQGGHGAYIDTWRLESWADRYAQAYFSERLLTS